MVQTPLSLGHNPASKGVQKNRVHPAGDVPIYSGAKFPCPCAGEIGPMPGTASNPGLGRVDVDVHTGSVNWLRFARSGSPGLGGALWPSLSLEESSASQTRKTGRRAGCGRGCRSRTGLPSLPPETNLCLRTT
jgi:hypothetical protein